jgi:hypothetical protein
MMEPLLTPPSLRQKKGGLLLTGADFGGFLGCFSGLSLGIV